MADVELPKPGDLIGVRYRIESLLGQGGMGAVFAALNQATGRAVAIKWMLPGAARSQDSVTRFLAEARATARIEHPNVIQILDVGQDGDAPFLVMERLRGRSLADRLERGKLSPLETLEVMIASCRGVAEAHSEGIIHRDLKPDNIFLCEGKDGSPRPPKVLDFGISKLYDQQGGVSLTQTGIAMGTPQYMSPEQLNAPPDADARFDVYAMGIVLYECLTGHPPYRAEGLFELVQQIASGNPTPIRMVSPDVPPDLETVVMRAMHVHRDTRYATMGEVIAELTRVHDRMRSGAPLGIAATGPHGQGGHAQGGHVQSGHVQSGHGAYTPAPSTGPLGGAAAWTPPPGHGTGPQAYGTPNAGYAPPSGPYGAPSAYGASSPSAYGAGTGGYGSPPSGPVHSGPVYSAPAQASGGGGGGLVLGAVVAVVGLGLLAVVGVGGAFLLFGGRSETTPTPIGSTAPATPGETGGGGAAAAPLENPRDPQIELTFTGACAPRFTARRMVVASADSLSVISSTMGGVTGSLQFSMPDLTGVQEITTIRRTQNQLVINVMAGQELWTNLALDSGPVMSGRVADPIRGTLTINQFDSGLAQSDLVFQDVTLQNLSSGTLCTINGRLRTTGQTYGY